MQIDHAGVGIEAVENDVAAVLGHRGPNLGVEQLLDLGHDLGGLALIDGLVGGPVLANVLAATQPGGAVAACGNAAGMELATSVAPFILRGIALLGVESSHAEKELRLRAWRRLASDLDRDKLGTLSSTIGFDDIAAAARAIADGKVRGRIVVEMP